jgi:alkaline phosphatase
LLVLWVIMAGLLPSSVRVASAHPANVILFIGDGMGFEQVRAAAMYASGTEGTLSFELFPYRAETRTKSADSSIPDSAAAATAIATGVKVNNGVISMALPGDGRELETLLEYFRDRGKSTGLVTTTYLTHATPACFAAHEPSRDNLAQIAADYLQQTVPQVMLGGGGNGLESVSVSQAGYTVVADRGEMQSQDTETVVRLCGLFGTAHLPYEYDGVGTLPHLSEMTSTALDILDNDPDGFFLVVEGGRIDHAGQANDLPRCVYEVIELANAVKVARDWADGSDDTLIIVTGDHETGGLRVIGNNGQGDFPSVSWATTGHTGSHVPAYAWGDHAELLQGVMENTDLFAVVTAGTGPVPTASEPQGSGSGGGGCAITSVVRGSWIEKHLELLRRFRDRFLLTNATGSALADLYYTLSPPVAELMSRHDRLRAAVRWSVLPVVGFSWLASRMGLCAALSLLGLVAALAAGGPLVLRRRRRKPHPPS